LILPTVGNLQFIQLQRLGQSLLRQSLLREHLGRTRGTLLALPRVEQNELLNLLQLVDELFHGKVAPTQLAERKETFIAPECTSTLCRRWRTWPAELVGMLA